MYFHGIILLDNTFGWNMELDLANKVAQETGPNRDGGGVIAAEDARKVMDLCLVGRDWDKLREVAAISRTS
jgi:hypothetical protein